MDLVYPNIQTRWNCNELRLSLRSAEKYLKFDRVIVIGYLPEFLRTDKIVHIPFKENVAAKWKNLENKFLLIIDSPEISEDFIYMNDDFWLFKEYNPVPYFYKGLLSKVVHKRTRGIYAKRLRKTMKIFPNGKNFELHFPIIFNKIKLRAIIKKYGTGVERRSIYCNEYNIVGIKSKDYKVAKAEKIKEYKKAPFMSATDIAVTHIELAEFLFKRYPEPSSYEIDESEKIEKTRGELLEIIESYKKKNYRKYLQKKDELNRKLKLIELRLWTKKEQK